MKITSIDIIDVANDFSSATSKWRPTVVRVNTDEGISGFGEVGLAYGVGASGGIGSAIARRFAAEGFRLALCGRNTEKLEAVRASLPQGTEALLLPGDVNDAGYQDACLAAVQALGATNSFTVGVYNVAEKKYYANTFSGSFEIVSLTGTINTMNGAFYTHLHMSAGNDKGEVFGGHLNRAVVSATCEMVVDVLDGTVDRQYDPVTGLNLFKF